MREEIYRLHSAKETGGTIAEIVLELSELPYEVRRLNFESLPTNSDYGRLNPLRQVPTLELPTGELMTESLAICTHLCELSGLGLMPKPGSKGRATYLRWSTFLVASIYPTFTFGDDPSRFVKDKTAQDELRRSSDAFRERMWKQVEAAADPHGPWFLGAEPSLVDVYVSVMSSWRPGFAWFEAETPRLTALAKRFRETPAFRKVWANNE